jgi:hypothetical protein
MQEEPKITPKQETADLSLISEDESTKKHYIRVSLSLYLYYFISLD